MGSQKLSRRKFFESLRHDRSVTIDEIPGDHYESDDPLFDKYARKKLGPREYKTDLVNYDVARVADDAVRVGNVTSGLAPYTGAWTEWEVLHLLRRTGFGFKKAKVDALVALNPGAAVDAILNIDTTPPPPPVNWYNIVAADENAVPYGADWTTSNFNSTTVGGTSNSNRVAGMRRWLFGQALNNDSTIREKMTWFWYHFIPIDFNSISESSNTYINTNGARVFYSYFKLMRDNALGNYKSLIRKVCTEPGMMFYLNNQKNSATSPDENFARELMELFTIGKDVVPAYTQEDVVAAAKVLTGWRVQDLNLATIATRFVPGSHSTANKVFSPFFGNGTTGTTINYQSGANGANELDQLITMIFNKSDIVSKYICRRLYRFFVYYDIDANIEANVITPLAQTFVNNNWEILPVINQLLKSQHFFDMANRGVYIKTPFDLVAGTLRTFNVNTNASDATNFQAQYQLWSYYNDSICLPMEQQMGTIPNVSGWNPFYQTPAYHEYWINTNTIQKRFKFLQDLLNGYTLTYNTLATILKIDTIGFAQQFGNTIAGDPNALVDVCIKYLIPLDLSPTQKASIKQQTLLSGQTTDGYWTTAWTNYIGNTSNTTFKNVVDSRIKSLLTTIVQLAEYQLM